MLNNLVHKRKSALFLKKKGLCNECKSGLKIMILKFGLLITSKYQAYAASLNFDAFIMYYSRVIIYLLFLLQYMSGFGNEFSSEDPRCPDSLPKGQVSSG